MEWVETTGRTIEEAKEAALDELGVDEQDAEFEVLEEPKVGLFGRLRSEGRIRARVRPTTPRAKDDRRDRRRRSKGSGDTAGAEPSAATAAPAARSASRPATGSRSAPGAPPATRPARPGRTRAAEPGAAASGETDSDSSSGLRTNPSRRRGGRGGTRPAAIAPNPTGSEPAELTSAEPASAGSSSPDSSAPESAEVSGVAAAGDDAPRPVSTRSRSRKRASAKTDAASRDDGNDAVEGTLMDVALDEQGKVAEQFLLGLLDSFALPAQVAVSVPDDETIDIQVTGEDLGLLIGPKGSTLLSIQDLTRTVVQRKTNAGNGRIFIDVSGYRQKRNEALSRFAHKVAADVLASQSRIAMEPMSAPDRKTVHDAITDIEGVDTISEGEDAMRHVVVVPQGD
jgi:spoIIIJ-associated protein